MAVANFLYRFILVPLFVLGDIQRLRNTEFESLNRTSGIALVDADSDGRSEVIVAVLDGPNLVLRYDIEREIFVNIAIPDSPYRLLMDKQGRTVSVSSCDLDGDGRDEIYIHNSNSEFTSRPVPDKLYTWQNDGFVDLFGQSWNKALAPKYGGHSASCVDIHGNGRYAFLVSTYTRDGRGSFKLLAMDEEHADNNPSRGNVVISDIAGLVGLNITRDARGIAVGPLFGNRGKSDIVVTNDNSYYIGSSIFRHRGENAMFRNNGDGTFTDVAENLGLSDADENGRTVSMVDLDNDGQNDIVYMNWLGPNRIFRQNKARTYRFTQIPGNTEFTRAGPSEIMLISDLDNDGNLDILVNGAYDHNIYQTTNQWFSVGVENGTEVTLRSMSFNNTELEILQIKGVSAGDLNGNGILELYISHQLYEGRTLSIFEMSSNHNWIRIFPKSVTGASARGAKVTMTTTEDSTQHRIIGEGCGYMCLMEPVAHFGLANSFPKNLNIQWPDGHIVKSFLHMTHVNKTLIITYSGGIRELKSNKTNSSSVSGANSLRHHDKGYIFAIFAYFVLVVLYV